MDDNTLHFATAVITAFVGLVGVALGGWITSYSQRTERRKAWRRRQLEEFYAPLLAMRLRILSKSESRERITNATARGLQGRYEGAGIQHQIALQKEDEGKFESVIDYNNRQLREELLPQYRKMIDQFAANMGLAEPATREYFQELIHFVDVWDRLEADALPAEGLREVGHSEKKLYPFYEDLAENVRRIQEELKK